MTDGSPAVFLKRQASWRSDLWDELPAVSTIEPKIRIRREHYRALVQFSHANEACIRQANRHIARCEICATGSSFPSLASVKNLRVRPLPLRLCDFA
jgi:hypothetical protein